MLKRLIIGASAALVTGVAIYLLFGWHPDTIEYHANSFVKEKKWSSGERWIVTKMPDRVGDLLEKWKTARVERHYEALLRKGFLERCTVVVSNRPATDVLTEAMDPNKVGREFDDTFFCLETCTTNALTFVDRPRAVEIWKKLICQADVPETK